MQRDDLPEVRRGGVGVVEVAGALTASASVSPVLQIASAFAASSLRESVPSSEDLSSDPPHAAKPRHAATAMSTIVVLRYHGLAPCRLLDSYRASRSRGRGLRATLRASDRRALA